MIQSLLNSANVSRQLWKLLKRGPASKRCLKNSRKPRGPGGELQVNLSADGDMEGPLGRSWLEAVLSDDPKRSQDWMINRLEGASFEFTMDPTLDTSSEGVRVTPEASKSSGNKGSDAPKPDGVKL
jgi:hypothetical protein